MVGGGAHFQVNKGAKDQKMQREEKEKKEIHPRWESLLSNLCEVIVYEAE